MLTTIAIDRVTVGIDPGDKYSHYCELDVLNTWLIWLRFAQLRGQLTREQHADEIERVKGLLRASSEAHLGEFLRAWEARA